MARTKTEKATRRPRGFGSIEQRGPKTFRIRFSVNGERVYETIEAESLTAASNYAAEKRAEHEKQAKRRRRGQPNAIHFSALLDEYERDELPGLAKGSQASYSGSLGRFRTFFVDEQDDPKLNDLGRADVRRYLRWREQQGALRWKKRNGGQLSVRTVSKDFRVLRRLLSWAVEMEYLEASPAAGVKEPKADDRHVIILDDAQYEKLLEAAVDRPMAYLYILLLGETGLRAYSEALNLRWSDVDLAEGFVHVVSGRDGHRTKSGRSRHVPMTDRLREAMRSHLTRYRFAAYDGKAAEHVFHHAKTRRRHKAGQRVQSFKGAFAAAKKAAQLPATFRPHDLRHRRVTTWLAEGKPTALVQAAMGHHSITVTEKYLHLVPTNLRALVEDGPSRAELKALAR